MAMPLALATHTSPRGGICANGLTDSHAHRTSSESATHIMRAPQNNAINTCKRNTDNIARRCNVTSITLSKGGNPRTTSAS